MESQINSASSPGLAFCSICFCQYLRLFEGDRRQFFDRFKATVPPEQTKSKMREQGLVGNSLCFPTIPNNQGSDFDFVVRNLKNIIFCTAIKEWMVLKERNISICHGT